VWKAVEFRLDKTINMVPWWCFATVNTYCFVATHGNAPPKIVFAPTSNCVQYLADFTPGLSVGHWLYLSGRDAIRRWISSTQQPEVTADGVSLGGNLCYWLALDYEPNQVEIHAYVAPGLLPWDIGDRPVRGKSFLDSHDPISQTGLHPNVDLYVVTRDRECCVLFNHYRAFGFQKSQVNRKNVALENGSWHRILMTIVHQLCSLFFFFPFAILHIVLLILTALYTGLAWLVTSSMRLVELMLNCCGA
jgi:hypothetical protein